MCAPPRRAGGARGAGLAGRGGRAAETRNDQRSNPKRRTGRPALLWKGDDSQVITPGELRPLDGNGNTKPTALHFTAGQQEFLAMVRQLREGLRATVRTRGIAVVLRSKSSRRPAPAARPGEARDYSPRRSFARYRARDVARACTRETNRAMAANPNLAASTGSPPMSALMSA